MSLTLLLLLTFPALATWPQDNSIVTSANGQGVLKVGQEEFKVTAAVVKLLQDGTAEIHIVSEITIFVSGTWAKADGPQINLKITGGATTGKLEGGGKLFLRSDGKSIESLKLQMLNKNANRAIDLDFVGQ
jgi:hypothetical protein